MTLARAMLDISEREFAPGLTYVAVSRVKILRGIMFKALFDLQDLNPRTESETMAFRKQEGCLYAPQAYFSRDSTKTWQDWIPRIVLIDHMSTRWYLPSGDNTSCSSDLIYSTIFFSRNFYATLRSRKRWGLELEIKQLFANFINVPGR
ncbi:hypothetical protein P152DRAFT_431916 [Eremomyces bilateralis CBS 781.70]|uniref:Uncharacterized protein n=1 Tax=Eremomyces bilateralis CBS 781.70 TaxID=1392243 RepID=A0A6G1G8M4_9PEZI|nr:uncharacterized protein P152DRAFT_431916 [Eremomyces bilateralis CBS 781.70]KAF1814209.1 hypothetical protein P152DRAFT_431916 [Eremomyces bilateralis CBS 781.70]